MNQNQLHREVAQKTGESVSTIKRLGFFLEGPFVDGEPVDLAPQVVDFDELDRHRGQANRAELAHV